jgi:hypothetical protein
MAKSPAERAVQSAQIVERFQKLDPCAQQIFLDEIERLEEIDRERKRLGRDPDAIIN